MDSASITGLLQSMNSSTIINTLEALSSSGVNLTSTVDVPTVISSLNITQVEGLLASDSTVVNKLLQSLTPVQLFTVVENFQNVTSGLFYSASMATNATLADAYTTTGVTLVNLLMVKVQNVFTDSQLLGLFKLMTNGAAFGTGSMKLLSLAKTLIAGFFGGSAPKSVAVPTRLTNLVADYQPAIFGDYPHASDVAPSAIFLAIFAVITAIHTGLFVKNYSLGHKFYISLGLAFYSLMRTLSFILRLAWAKNFLNLSLGLTATIFLVLCTIFLPTLNLILAQRYFTWKHPSYGSHKLFTSVMYIIYSLAIILVAMSIIAACVQTIYLLSEHHFNETKQVLQASSVLIMVYSVVSAALVLVAQLIPATKADTKILTFQPYWIKSFSWNYFVTKGAAKSEYQLVSNDQKHAIRVINSSTYHYETTHDAKDLEGTNMKHNSSIFIISLTTVLLIIADAFRVASTFEDQYHYEQSWIFDHTVMYVMFGALEVIVNIAYIVGRIDLRFYKPDCVCMSSAVSRDQESHDSHAQKDDLESTESAHASAEVSAEVSAQEFHTEKEGEPQAGA